MKGLTTKAMIADRYGMRLNMAQVAEILDLTTNTVYNMISAGELPIRTYKEGKRRFASYEAVADYLDSMDEQAKKNPGE